MDALKHLTEKVETCVRRDLAAMVNDVVKHVRSYDTHLAVKPYANGDEIHSDWKLNGDWNLRGIMFCLAEEFGYRVFHRRDISNSQTSMLEKECNEGTYGWSTQFIERTTKKRLDALVSGDASAGDYADDKREVRVSLDGTTLHPDAWKLKGDDDE